MIMLNVSIYFLLLYRSFISSLPLGILSMIHNEFQMLIEFDVMILKFGLIDFSKVSLKYAKIHGHSSLY